MFSGLSGAFSQQFAVGDQLTWTTGETYEQGQQVYADGNIYVVVNDYTAGADVQTDVAAGNLQLIDTVSSIVFREGGTSGDNVYATWAEVKTYAENFDGHLRVLFDDSVTSPMVIDANTDLYGVHFDQASDIAPVNVNVADGVTITGLDSMRGISLNFLGDTSRFAFGNNQYFEMYNQSSIETQSSTAAPIQFSSGIAVISLYNTSRLKLTNYEVIDVSSGGTLIVTNQEGGIIDSDVIRGTGTYSLTVRGDAGSTQKTQPTNHSGGFSVSFPTKGFNIDRDETDQLTYTDFTAGGAVTEYSVTAFTIEAGNAIDNPQLKVATFFAGTGISAGQVTAKLGISGQLDKFIGSFDVTQSPTNKIVPQRFELDNLSVAETVLLTLTITGGAVMSDLTAGVINATRETIR